VEKTLRGCFEGQSRKRRQRKNNLNKWSVESEKKALMCFLGPKLVSG
jgi:hypothetical protein